MVYQLWKFCGTLLLVMIIDGEVSEVAS